MSPKDFPPVNCVNLKGLLTSFSRLWIIHYKVDSLCWLLFSPLYLFSTLLYPDLCPRRLAFCRQSPRIPLPSDFQLHQKNEWKGGRHMTCWCLCTWIPPCSGAEKKLMTFPSSTTAFKQGPPYTTSTDPRSHRFFQAWDCNLNTLLLAPGSSHLIPADRNASMWLLAFW